MKDPYLGAQGTVLALYDVVIRAICFLSNVIIFCHNKSSPHSYDGRTQTSDYLDLLIAQFPPTMDGPIYDYLDLLMAQTQ